MIYRNGQLTRTNYMNLYEHASTLATRTGMYRDHLHTLSKDTYRLFAEMKSDIDQKLIDPSVYLQLLNGLKYFFDNTQAPYEGSLKADEIIAEIQKYNTGWKPMGC
jgi:hypothetical protein